MKDLKCTVAKDYCGAEPEDCVHGRSLHFTFQRNWKLIPSLEMLCMGYVKKHLSVSHCSTFSCRKWTQRFIFTHFFWSVYVLVMKDSCGQLYVRGSCQSCMQVISWAPVKEACPFSKFSISGGRIKVNLMPFNSHDWLSREHLQKSLKVQHLKYYLLIQQSWVWNFAYWSYWGTAAKYACLSWVVWSNWCMQSQRRGSKKTVEITLHLFSVVCSSDSSSCFTRGRPP